ncbi:MAG: putative Rhomboid family protein [Myxococcaceae bacterium]|nr:putative Rhomboid family protein [Myxococcaceae bacterium]
MFLPVARAAPQFDVTVPMVVIASVAAVSFVAWAIKPIKQAFVLNPYLVRHRLQLWRLVTAGWLHADASHLIFNMLTLYFFSDNVVRALGSARFLLLYFTAVVVAHIPTTIRHMNNPKYNSLGASGAVAAVMFSAIALYPGLRLSLLFLPIPVPGYVYALGYLAYSAYASYRARDGVNHDAHFAGAIYGSLLTFAFEPERVTKTLQSFFS